MKLRLPLAVLLGAPILAGCGLTLPAHAPADTGGAAAASAGAAALDTPDARQHQAERMADLLVALARAAGRPSGRTGWAGSWYPCETYTGHQVEFRVSGSFDAEAYGLEPKQAIVDAAQASGWRVEDVLINARRMSFDLVGDGVSGDIIVTDTGVELEVGVDCMDVSAEDAQRLEARGSVGRS
ncbi:MAG TPA: hypothetical protein VJ872_07485 [Nocardioides sp.]|nr:hypothetical protein [Nocardioides sp.]